MSVSAGLQNFAVPRALARKLHSVAVRVNPNVTVLNMG
jgi:hypothetical protein